jgi:hypothetical protein
MSTAHSAARRAASCGEFADSKATASASAEARTITPAWCATMSLIQLKERLSIAISALAGYASEPRAKPRSCASSSVTSRVSRSSRRGVNIFSIRSLSRAMVPPRGQLTLAARRGARRA